MRSILGPLRSLSSDQRNAFLAAFLGWTLDAFDFFLMVFVMKDIADAFHVKKTAVSFALTLTLGFRPVGALIFGLAADKFGRRGPLMVDVIFYSLMELLTGFAPTLTAFFVLRALFGIAMGGEWGLGASLAMESVPPETRGVLSGLLQEGYVCGYLLAAVAYRFIFPFFGWRGMFFIGVLPALLSIFIRAKVKESPVWLEKGQSKTGKSDVQAPLGQAIRQNIGLFVYLALLMAAFNFMSHGTQDMYPTFLQVQHKFGTNTVSNIAIIANIGALIGGIFFGTLSQKVGRRRAIVIACVLALPLVPLWAFSHTAVMLAIGAFALQFMLQGAWGVIPAHLSELSPNALRGTFTGFAYQVGNLIASVNGPLQSWLAERNHNDYSTALASTVVVAIICAAVITSLGKEKRDIIFAGAQAER